jgi:hypothetical protein
MRLRQPLVLAALLAVSPAAAQDVDSSPDVDPLALQIHGFVSQGFLLTTDNNYLADSERGSFEFTEVGLNFTQPLTDELRVGLQLFARDLGPLGDYSIKADWFYVDYRHASWLGLRAGRVKLPFGLYNEVNDIDQARVPILLPQSVYPVQNRDFLLAQTGVEVYGYVQLGNGGGALDYRLYAGTIFLETNLAPGSPYDIESLNIPYVAGGRLLWETPLPGLRAGGSVQVLRLDADLLFDPMTFAPLVAADALPADFDGRVNVEVPALLWVGSIEYLFENLQLALEYSRWHVEAESSEPALFPESDTTSERLYGMGAYRINSWFEPGLYYSLFFPDVDDRDSSRDKSQHDIAATLRFDINRHWLVKVEGHYMRGTAALNTALNDGTPRVNLTRTWGLFLVKTTAYF